MIALPLQSPSYQTRNLRNCSFDESTRKVRWGLVLILGISTALPGIASAGPLTADKSAAIRLLQLDGQDLQASHATLEKAIEAFRQGQEDVCLNSLRSAVEQTPALPPPKLMLARMLLQTGRVAEALQRLDRLAVESSDEPEVYASLGEIALSQGTLF